jgi:hypothetical protein
MIPFLMFPPPVATSTTAEAWFDVAGEVQETMTTAESQSVNLDYNNPGYNIDRVSFKVEIGGTTTEWSFAAPGSPTDALLTGAAFSASSSGWVGAGLYRLWFEGRSYPSGLYDQISNNVYLLVT